jgi:hypothetical protein
MSAKILASRGFVAVVEVVYLLALFVVAFVYLTDPAGAFHATWDKLAPFPVGVLWFGALGAVIISLSGVFDHRQDWDPGWNLWHFTRPLIGVSLAVISWVIFQAGILAVGSQIPNQQSGTPTNLLFYLIAFVVGYREDVFRSLIKRVADVILTPAGGAAAVPPPVIVGLNPPTGAAGQRVTIAGSGLAAATGVAFGANAGLNFQADSDAQVSVSAPPGTGSVSVTVATRAGSVKAGEFTYS